MRPAAGFHLKKLPPPLEREDQATYFNWLKAIRYDGVCLYDFAFAVPNGSYLHGDVAKRAIQGGALRAQGVKAGVMDVFIEIPVAPYHGLRIEFKRKGGIPSDVSEEQAAWIMRLRSRGYDVRICFGLDSAIAATREYFKIGGG